MSSPMSSHKIRREEEEKGGEGRVAGRAAAVGDGEEKESREQTAEAAAAIRMQSDDSESGSAAAAAASPASSSSRLLPPRADLPECELCRLPLQSADGGGSSVGGGRLPRLLPCGHSWCTECIDKMLQRSDNLVTCPQRCAFKHELRVDSVAELPKNFALMKVIEQTASRAAQTELGAPPCSQCDPDQPRRAASTFCEDCRLYFCEEHERLLHSVAAFENHRRVSLVVTAQQQQQAVAQQSRLLAQAAAPIKEQLLKHSKQLKDIDAESEQLIRSLPQKCKDYTNKQNASVAKWRQFVDGLERGFLQQKELMEAGHRDLVAHQPWIAPLRAAVDALLQGSDLDIASRGGAVQQQCTEMLNKLAATKAQVQPGEAPSTECLFGLQLLFLTSAILQPSHAADMCRFFKGISVSHAQLLYRATRDGFEANDLWQRCAGKGPTLTIVKVAGSGSICGAYTPLSWPANVAARYGHVADPSGRTFLFSLVNAHGRAVKLRLKADQRAKALYLGGVGSGPGFGWGADLRLMRAKAANQSDGCSTYPYSFELDGDSERAAGLPPISFAFDKTLLGGVGYDSATFAAAEIEVYQL